MKMMNAKFTKIAGIAAAILVGISTFGITAYAGTKWIGSRNANKAKVTKEQSETETITDQNGQTRDGSDASDSRSNRSWNDNYNIPDQNDGAEGYGNFGDFGNSDNYGNFGNSDNFNGFGGFGNGQDGFGNGQNGSNGFGNFGGFGGPGENNVTIAENPSEIVTGEVTSSAQLLTADMENAETIVMSDSNNEVKISAPGTYIVTGTCADGNITVKKETTGVVLILKDLDLTSTAGAPVSLNKSSEVQLVIEGNVKLTDAEDPADENSLISEVADAFDGAAIKVKDGANVYITGSGKLTIDASSCKNGIKSGDEEGTVLVIDGPEISVTAANDAFNAGRDLTILSGKISISAGDDAIHADRILTIGTDNGSGPVINISTCKEGLEGSVVNVYSGKIDINAQDDAVNAANSDKTYASELRFAVNILGGTITINSRGDGIDSNQDINLIAGTITINSASNGGEAGIDYDGDYYVSDNVVLNNNSGVSGPDMMGGFGGFGDNNGQGNFGGFGDGNGQGNFGGFGDSNGQNNFGGFGGSNGQDNFSGFGGRGGFPGGKTPNESTPWNRNDNEDQNNTENRNGSEDQN